MKSLKPIVLSKVELTYIKTDNKHYEYDICVKIDRSIPAPIVPEVFQATLDAWENYLNERDCKEITIEKLKSAIALERASQN